ncbi:MAG: NAD-dependent epimerase/dehydratase family protein [Gemmatales bacterium]|nr:NAD-dependent epimerase/dehydratase family protein [Gemmatales bacterium]MDW7993155.1 NAD-dependent epimerase/dehydratase family protein [Gemmatales bacterium]
MSSSLNLGFWRDRPVAVTGATGFLGSHVCQLLVSLQARVRALIRPSSITRHLRGLDLELVVAPLDDEQLLVRALGGQDIILHLAGSVHFRNDWQSAWQTNVEGSRRLLEAASRARVRRIVYVSSIVTIGATREPHVLDESTPWNLSHVDVPYIQSKHFAEQLILGHAHRGWNIVVVNPGCIVGPDDYGHSEFGVLCRRFWHGRIPFVFRGGANFVDVRDVAQGVLLAAQWGRRGHRYILGGVNRTWLDFFRDLARLSPRPIPRMWMPTGLAPALALLGRFLDQRPGKRPYLSKAQAELISWFFFVSNQKASEELGYRVRSWQETIRDTYIFWMRHDPDSH